MFIHAATFGLRVAVFVVRGRVEEGRWFFPAPGLSGGDRRSRGRRMLIYIKGW
jgi:hypothetical protein